MEHKRNLFPEQAIQQGVSLFSHLRAMNFTAQFLALDWLTGFVPSTQRVHRKGDLQLLKKLRAELLSFLKEDAKLFSSGLLPLNLLRPEGTRSHLSRLPKLFFDGIEIYQRRKNNRAKDFDLAAPGSASKTSRLLEQFPDYYLRNFHFQSNGYLSRESAELYDHQVEMLFSGSADAMRRLLIKPLNEHFKGLTSTASHKDGMGLTLLEVGCGTGRGTKMVSALLPKVKIIALDLSPHYLKFAQEQFRDNLQVDFLQGDGADLKFSDNSFDGIFSIFTFHELPLAVRRQVLKEIWRVLKPGGFIGIVDAIQAGDSETFDKTLEDFPLNYHEPFFKNYTQHPLAALAIESGFRTVCNQTGFASKVYTGLKPKVTVRKTKLRT